MAKRAAYTPTTPYHLIMIKYKNMRYYTGADRIVKNSTLEQAKIKAQEIWRQLPSPYFLEIRNQFNLIVYEHETTKQ